MPTDASDSATDHTANHTTNHTTDHTTDPDSDPATRSASDSGDGWGADARNAYRWRTVDIVVAAVIGAAFGVIFWAWNSLWDGVASAIPLPGRAVLYGVWLVPAILGPLVIRKPGAGVFCELVAASVATLFGSPWGLVTLLYGVLQGMAGEFGFAFTAYRVWRWPTAVAGGALAGVAAALLDNALYYAADSTGWQIAYTAIVVASSALVAGLGSLALTKSLAQTGALDPFPSGRERAAV